MLAPIVRKAAEQYPDVAFTMLSQQRFADLFGDMPENVTFHGVDLKKQSLHEIVKGLGKFDAVADMHSVLRSFYIRSAMLLKGARVASIDKGRSDKRKLTSGKIHSPLKHTTERYAEVFKTLYLPISDRDCTDVGPMLDRERTDEVAEKSARMSAVWTMMRVKLVNFANFVMQFLKWTKWTKWTEQIFDESLKSLRVSKQIFT